MEVKIKSMKHEDFKDNEYIDNLVEQSCRSWNSASLGGRMAK